MDGFDAGDRDIPVPPVEVSEDTRARMALTLMAIIQGATPEELAEYVENGFPDEIAAALDRPHEREEIDAHVSLLLYVQQTPGVPAGA